MQHGGASKDTWVLSDQPVEELTLLQPSGDGVELRRVGNNLPSRLADNFFWLGRYAERADATARLLRSALLAFQSGKHRGRDAAAGPDSANAQIASGSRGEGDPASERSAPVLETGLLARDIRFGPAGKPAGHGGEFATAGHFPAGPHVQRSLAGAAHRWPSGWPCRPAPWACRPATPSACLIKRCSAWPPSAGLARENMTRAHGWRFLDMGQRIERVHLSLRLSRPRPAARPKPTTPACWKRCWKWPTAPSPIAAATISCPTSPPSMTWCCWTTPTRASLLFQLNQLVKHFERLPGERENALPSPGQRVLLECLTSLRLLDPRGLKRTEGSWQETRGRAESSSKSCATCPASPTPLPPVTSPIPPFRAPAAGPSYDLRHRPSHDLRLHRAGDRFASRRARAKPRALPSQVLEEFSLHIDPPPAVRKTRTDYFGNRVCFFSIQEIHRRLEIVGQAASPSPPSHRRPRPLAGVGEGRRGCSPIPSRPEVVDRMSLCLTHRCCAPRPPWPITRGPVSAPTPLCWPRSWT